MGFVLFLLVVVCVIFYIENKKQNITHKKYNSVELSSIDDINNAILEKENIISEIKEKNDNCQKRIDSIKNAIAAMDESVSDEDKDVFNDKIKVIEAEILENNSNMDKLESEKEKLMRDLETKNKEQELSKADIKEEDSSEEIINDKNVKDIKEENKITTTNNKKNWKKIILRKETIIPFVVGIIIGAFIFNDSSSIAEYQAQIEEKDSKIQELQAKVDEAAPWFEMTAAEQAKKEAQLQAEKEAQEKAEAEKQEAERKKREEEAKKGYETGITFEQLARTPDDYLAKKVKFSGKVVQSMEDGTSVTIRLAVDGDYDKIILGSYDSSIISERILEEDYITVYGLSTGIYTYESTMGASISVPSMTIDKISR
ncbi:coiled-coil domain-containing protein [Peptacetobacter hominis]|uniref:hypothetical protein n=1 Tax=Peptacetobacter hominis TaxID=2743610 RepID=UPI001FE67550|nr:hypothetical protein [Peptacetobacter hominis]